MRTKFLIFILVCLRFAFRDFMPEYLTRMSGNARVPVNADQKRRLRTIIYYLHAVNFNLNCYSSTGRGKLHQQFPQTSARGCGEKVRTAFDSIIIL